MQSIIKFYAPIPGNSDAPDPKDNLPDEDKIIDADSLLSDNKDENKPEHNEHKGFKATLRDALQEWSNDDARDIKEDDSTPMRSGL